MSRINEHKFELNNEEYLLTWYDKPRLTKNGIKQEVKSVLREYITKKNLPIQIVNSNGNDEVPWTLSRKILEHFSNNTFKIKKTISKSINNETKPTLKNTTINFTNSKDSISNSNKDKLYLIPCSSSKISKEELEDKPFDINKLEFNSELGIFRKELIRKLKISENKNTHKRDKKVTKNKKTKIEVINIKNEFNFHSSAQAHKLYSKGKYYHSTSSDSLNWTENDKEKIYIVSALFGIIKANNYIPLYNLAMGDEIDNHENFAKKFWKGKLDSIVEKLIDNGYFVYNLLSQDYSYCLNKKSLSLILKPNEKFNGRGEQQGKWLKKQLKTK